ncbi:type II toxin-antitoxin system VapC family toxin [Oscillatoria acuminata]|uniref:Ribonuclease VapC n=1 Tax=Oscillatoria acuminata PCC 6304 TaxID=56110 RepID=K9TBL3_9CYAN|nr:PIN domain-containing protein [Oscillatoria acuminata]AFY79935.1 putative nucleic acid-binding protein, contains PIN domain [Oscillatoria acuminata PCC 6304]
MKNSVFVDTSGWANLFIKTEPDHPYAVEWFTQARQQKYLMVTSNYIVLELVALLNSPLRVPRPQIFQYIDAIHSAPYLQLVRVNQQIENAAWELLKKRLDKTWSLVDATSFIIMQQLEITNALTSDHHFDQAGFVRLLKS